MRPISQTSNKRDHSLLHPAMSAIHHLVSSRYGTKSQTFFKFQPNCKVLLFGKFLIRKCETFSVLPSSRLITFCSSRSKLLLVSNFIVMIFLLFNSFVCNNTIFVKWDCERINIVVVNSRRVFEFHSSVSILTCRVQKGGFD